MMTLIDAILVVAAALGLFIAAFFALEVLGALLPMRRPPSGAPPMKVAVVIPAHNEEAGVAATIASVAPEIREGDRLIVVADNCEDGTAEAAAAAGAEVMTRSDPSRRGKGYALKFAVDALAADPPDIVCFIDADCRVEPGAVARVADAAAASGRPAQALYLMTPPAGAPAARSVAAFAWLVMNRVRMGGLYTLFDATRLTGSCMALPFALARTLDFASGEIVEDLAMTLAAAEAGKAPVFVVDAVATSEFARAESAAVAQRARWEHGSLRLAERRAPGLFIKALKARDVRLAALALDLAVPPLSVLGAAIAATLVLALIGGLMGAGSAIGVAASAALVLAGAVGIAWVAFGRRALPPAMAGAAAAYVLDKAKVYGAKARASTRTWTRTARDERASPSPPTSPTPTSPPTTPPPPTEP